MTSPRKTLHIAAIADDKYKRPLAAMIASAIRSAADSYKLVFHILGDSYSAETIGIISSFITSGGHEIRWMEDLSQGVDIPQTVYAARVVSLLLFLSDMMDPAIDQVIYVDADTVFADNGIERFAQIDIGNKALGVVTDADVAFEYMSKRTGITDSTYRYFNSGVMIINLKKWRAQNATAWHIKVLEERYGQLVMVDQDVLNICWKDDLYYLPLNFNVTSANYMLSPAFLAKGYGSPYYTAAEIKDAKNHPYVLHFYGYTCDRPWREFCYHPKKQLYIDAANASPYPFAVEKTPEKDKREYIKMRLFGSGLLSFRRGKRRLASRAKGLARRLSGK